MYMHVHAALISIMTSLEAYEDDTHVNIHVYCTYIHGVTVVTMSIISERLLMPNHTITTCNHTGYNY